MSFRAARADPGAEKRVALPGCSDGKRFVHRWRDDGLAVLSEVLRMSVGQVTFVSFDAERLESPNIFSERLRTAEPVVNGIYLLDGKHD